MPDGPGSGRADRSGTAGREGGGQGANGHVNKGVPDTATGSLMTRLKELFERFDTLVVRLAEELPRSIANGFDAIKDTIVKTGGTGHLRTMLTDHDNAHTARLGAMETAREIAGVEQAAALKNLQDVLVAKIDTLKSEVQALRAWHKERRWAAAGVPSACCCCLSRWVYSWLIPRLRAGFQFA